MCRLNYLKLGPTYVCTYILFHSSLVASLESLTVLVKCEDSLEENLNTDSHSFYSSNQHFIKSYPITS